MGQEKSLGITPHALGSIGKHEGMNHHTHRELHFGNWSSGELLNLQRAISGVKTQWIETFIILLKSS